MGYGYIALGGMVPLKTPEILDVPGGDRRRCASPGTRSTCSA